MNTKNITAIIIVLLAIVGVVWLVTRPQIPVTSNDNVEPGSVVHNVPPTGSAGFAKLGPNAIYVAEQRPGNQVIVNVVNMTSPGYVVIHESVNGMPGAVIGTSVQMDTPFENNIPVTLKRAIVDGDELIAMLHTEKSSTGFDAAVDTPVLDFDGNAMHMIFQVSKDAPDPSQVQVMF